jgi:hypothetical protein
MVGEKGGTTMLAQVIAGGGGGISYGLLPAIGLIIVLGLIAGLVDRIPILDANFKSIIKWICLVAAVVILIMLILRAFGVTTLF